jgi:hypothetical protein
MFKLLTFSILIFCTGFIFSQPSGFNKYYHTDPPDSAIYNQKMVMTTLSAGTIFSSSDSYGSFSGSYLMPGFSFSMSPKFRLKTGMLFYNSFLTGQGNSENTGNFNRQGSLLYVGGEYLLNDKIILHGNVFKDLSNFEKNINSYSMGMDYKVGNNSYIGFELHFSNQDQGMFQRLNNNSNGFNNIILY